jgi:predicted regulator of amino acid metabolism with ACT domain
MGNLPHTAGFVDRVIQTDGAIRRDLGRGLINIRALARYIQEDARKNGEEVSLEAVIGAIRRYDVREGVSSRQSIARLLKKLTMRNKIVDVAILNDPEITAALARFASTIDYSLGETFRLVSGVEAIRAVIDEKNLDRLKSIIPKKNLPRISTGLAEIIVSMSDVANNTPGVVSEVTSELAMNGINMIEFMSCVPELIIVVDEKDALRSYEAIEKLTRAGGEVESNPKP